MVFDEQYRTETTIEITHANWREVFTAVDRYKQVNGYTGRRSFGVVGQDGQFILVNDEQFTLLLYAEIALHRK